MAKDPNTPLPKPDGHMHMFQGAATSPAIDTGDGKHYHLTVDGGYTDKAPNGIRHSHSIGGQNTSED